MALKLARRILKPKPKPKSQLKPKVGKKRELKQSVEFRAEGWKKDFGLTKVNELDLSE